MTFSGKSLVTALRSPAKTKTICFILFVAGVIFKFWLIAGTDISDAIDDPHEYVVQILQPLDAGIAYGPGSGLFGRIFYELGLPFRLGMEMTFMGALTLVVGALIDWPTKSYLACGLFLFGIFNPTPAELFSHFYSDQIWMVETMMGLACLVFALRDPLHPKGLLLLCSAILFGFSTITRSVFEPLMGCLIGFTLMASILILHRGGWTKFRAMLFTFLISMYAVIMGTATLYYATCCYDLHRHHYFGISAIDCREYRDFYLCLQSVGDPTGVNYFPVDEDRRNLIAQAGPNAKALMEQINHNTFYKDIGFKTYGKYDIPAGWLHFTVFTVNGATQSVDLDSTYGQFKDIEREIHDAAQSGQLKVRSIIPLPDCRINLVLPILPASLQAVVDQMVTEPVPYPSGWSPEKLHYDNPDFSKALTRSAVSESPLRYHIWRILHAIYSHLYVTLAVYFLLLLIVAFWIFLTFTWRPTLENSLSLLAQQLFAILFIATLFWYTLFNASGMPILTRYMIFQNVMLPILIAYYLRSFITLGCDDVVKLEVKAD